MVASYVENGRGSLVSLYSVLRFTSGWNVVQVDQTSRQGEMV